MAGTLHRQMYYRGRRIHTWSGLDLQYMPLAPGDPGKVYGANLDGWIEIQGGITFEHLQETAAAVWNITHGLSCRHPRVLLLDDSGREFFAFIDYASATDNYVGVKMTIPTSGKAIVTAG